MEFRRVAQSLGCRVVAQCVIHGVVPAENILPPVVVIVPEPGCEAAVLILVERGGLCYVLEADLPMADTFVP